MSSVSPPKKIKKRKIGSRTKLKVNEVKDNDNSFDSCKTPDATEQ